MVLALDALQAMFVDFGMAAQYDGRCFLRFDDTNPEAEKQEYIDHIQASAWLRLHRQQGSRCVFGEPGVLPGRWRSCTPIEA